MRIVYTSTHRALLFMEQKKIGITVSDVTKTMLPSAWPLFLLEKFGPREIEKKGKALDLGTGSGILATALEKMGYQKIVASDITSKILQVAKNNFRRNGLNGEVQPVRSDLFEHLRGPFDLIVCNPPTFPDIPQARKGSDSDYAFFSGLYGTEFVEKLTNNVARFLSRNGRLILLHPSYLNTELRLKKLAANGLECRVIASKKILFRDYANSLARNEYDPGLMLDRLLVRKNKYEQKKVLQAADFTDKLAFRLDLIEAVRKSGRNSRVDCSWSAEWQKAYARKTCR